MYGCENLKCYVGLGDSQLSRIQLQFWCSSTDSRWIRYQYCNLRCCCDIVVRTPRTTQYSYTDTGSEVVVKHREKEKEIWTEALAFPTLYLHTDQTKGLCTKQLVHANIIYSHITHIHYTCTYTCHIGVESSTHSYKFVVCMHTSSFKLCVEGEYIYSL